MCPPDANRRGIHEVRGVRGPERLMASTRVTRRAGMPDRRMIVFGTRRVPQTVA